MKKIIKVLTVLALTLAEKVTAFAVTVDEILPLAGRDPQNAKDYPETAAVSNLPQVTDSQLITTIIKTILGAASLLTIIAIVVAGIYFLIARGEEEKATKAKGILTYLIIGMVIIAAAYAVISGVAQFDFLGK